MTGRADSAAANHLVAIDDEPELLAIVARTAESAGFKVDATTDPEIFKATIRRSAPSVVLMDLQIPGCDGIELLRFLYEEQCQAHIVLISGVDLRLLSIAKGVGDKLSLKMAEPVHKPIRVAELRARLSGFIAAPAEIDTAMIREALRTDQLALYYQPLVALDDHHVVGWEALARWHHPVRGLIMPDRFIPVAEKEGVIDELTDRVFELAIAQVAAWQRVHGMATFVSVNVSAPNLLDLHLPDRLEQACRQHQVPADLLRLELTETVAMSDSPRLVEVLTRLRVKGFKLAIDDFGTGYSSLVQLHRLPFSELKIDQMFVRNMATSEEAAIIVGAIINLAHSLRLELIAEGIETEELARRLVAAGCEIGQGYYFAKPMPAAEVPGWYAAHGQGRRAGGAPSG
jgi:EAL domain-containing protein (putative c-di-GMP-specific phosphodiesterase class I)